MIFLHDPFQRVWMSLTNDKLQYLINSSYHVVPTEICSLPTWDAAFLRCLCVKIRPVHASTFLLLFQKLKSVMLRMSLFKTINRFSKVVALLRRFENIGPGISHYESKKYWRLWPKILFLLLVQCVSYK